MENSPGSSGRKTNEGKNWILSGSQQPSIMPTSRIAIATKLPSTGTTVFSVMSKLALDHGALNLSQGFPGFPVDTRLISLVNRYMEKGYNQYAPMQGLPELRTRLSKMLESLYGRYYHPAEEITITAGGTQALFTAITALVRPGDEVIVFEPAYDCYVPAIELAGGIPVYCQLNAPDYRVPWPALRKLINRRTRMIVVNNPHNPSGTVWTHQDILELDKISRDSQIIVLSDEVYEHIVLDNRLHESMARNEKLSERSLIVGSFGKTLHATGWKMGYIAGPAELIQEFRKVHQYNVFSCNTPIQWAIAEYLEDEQVYLGLREFYTAKRDYFLRGLQGSRFEWTPAEGTYFQLLNYSKLSTEKDFDLARQLTTNNGVASIPVSVFNHNGKDDKMLRFCFAKDERTLEEATNILRQI